MARATSSLPVPDSPVTSTVASVAATLATCSRTRCMAGDPPSRPPGPASRRRSSSSAAARALAKRACRRSAGDLGRLLHPRRQELGREGLLHEVDGPGPHRLHRRGDAAVGGHHQHRGLRVELAEPAHHLEAVHRHHAEVGHHHVGLAPLVGRQRLGAAADAAHLVAEPRQGEDHAVAHGVAVVGHQDPGHHGESSPSESRRARAPAGGRQRRAAPRCRRPPDPGGRGCRRAPGPPGGPAPGRARCRARGWW